MNRTGHSAPRCPNAVSPKRRQADRGETRGRTEQPPVPLRERVRRPRCDSVTSDRGTTRPAQLFGLSGLPMLIGGGGLKFEPEKGEASQLGAGAGSGAGSAPATRRVRPADLRATTGPVPRIPTAEPSTPRAPLRPASPGRLPSLASCCTRREHPSARNHNCRRRKGSENHRRCRTGCTRPLRPPRPPPPPGEWIVPLRYPFLNLHGRIIFERLEPALGRLSSVGSRLLVTPARLLRLIGTPETADEVKSLRILSTDRSSLPCDSVGANRGFGGQERRCFR